MFSIIFPMGSVITGLFYLIIQKQNYKNLLFQTLYKLIYVFSFLQIKCIKVYGCITNLCSNKTISNEPITNAKEYKRYKLLPNSDTNSNTELVIVKENNLSLVINTSSNQESFINLIESNVRFIAITMIYNGEKYKIVLKTPEYNFYVVGNKIDNSFLQYYLTNILFIPLLHICTSKTPTLSEDLSVKCNSYHALEKCEGVNREETNFEYFLEIMDNDVNFVFLNERQHILLALDKYTLL